jgi:hypothetical protein
MRSHNKPIALAVLVGALLTVDLANAASKPPRNPYLASSLYAITHFDSSQSDSTPYGPPRKAYYVDASMAPIAYGGPINILTLASTNPNFMWQVGTDRVSYVKKYGLQWKTLSVFQALADADKDLPSIPDGNFRSFGESSAVGMTTTTMDSYLKSLFGNQYPKRFGSGTYVLVDRDNVLYAAYGETLYGLALINPKRPDQGIAPRYRLDDVINKIQGKPAPEGTKLSGLSMTYDGHLVLTFTNGVGVIDRNLDPDSAQFYGLGQGEQITNSIAIDDKGGIYVASNLLMHKLVWTGSTLSDKASDGAWTSPYLNSGQELPPIIKVNNGTGSTPTLMGFGKKDDKLVVITDGAKQMNLVAFWRDAIPAGFVQKPNTLSNRIADQIPVTCGFDPLPEWIQSEQSVVVSGTGAFVVNNIPQTVAPELAAVNNNKILQVSLMGPAYETSYGAQRFEWDPTQDAWHSVWTRPDVSSTSMVPIHSQSGNMALINGYRPAYGWEVVGLDWNTGKTAHHTIFGDANFGNGAYAILEYLKNGDLIFNSFSGPYRVHYGK